ncbi:MAG: phospho-N-acetylmuramoyl-pentapeptide-transferase [Corynebacteriales bacterium]|nr:phospho-N-acetylmuramoyl-pentapeptide-transferase [Mycobacteriales bacterium]
MISVLAAAITAFLITIFGTPIAIRYLRRLKVGQEIRAEGPQSHQSKAGTPTMGGVVFIFATVVAYGVGQIFMDPEDRGITVTALVLLGLFVGMGLVGFLDDYIKVRKRRSLGLNGRSKLVGQAIVAGGAAFAAMNFPNSRGWTMASDHLSFTKDLAWADLTPVGAAAFFAFVVIATANGVNLTDGLDGLATGSSIMVLLAYVAIAFWQFRNTCLGAKNPYCYEPRDSLDMSIIAAGGAAALFGFLWWNTSPAKVFMGDTGALGLGGLIAGLAMGTHTTLLLIPMGLLFLIITMSVMIQIISFKTTGRRVFRMAPLQHHFELAGWSEVNIVVRFWIIAGVGVAIALGTFYADYLGVSYAVR